MALVYCAASRRLLGTLHSARRNAALGYHDSQCAGHAVHDRVVSMVEAVMPKPIEAELADHVANGAAAV